MIKLSHKIIQQSILYFLDVFTLSDVYVLCLMHYLSSKKDGESSRTGFSK